MRYYTTVKKQKEELKRASSYFGERERLIIQFANEGRILTKLRIKGRF